MNYSSQQFKDRYNSLPRKMREVLASAEFTTEIENLGHIYHLSELQINTLNTTTQYVLMGFDNPYKLKENIKNDLSVGDDIAAKIDSDIKKKFFYGMDLFFRQILENTKRTEQENGNDFDIESYLASVEDEDSLGNKNDLIHKIKDIASNDANLKGLFDETIKERVREIARKYSLTPDQIDKLENKVLSSLLGLETPEDFLGSLINDLNLSDVLAEQIMSDLDTRVFDYALKTIEKRGEEKPLVSKPIPQQATPFVPENLPGAIEVQEKPIETRKAPAPAPQAIQTPTPVTPVPPAAPWMKQAPATPETPVQTPVEQKPVMEEPSHIVWPSQPTEIQVPAVPVPRFTATAPDEIPQEQTPAQTVPQNNTAPQNIIEAKLNSVVKPKIEKPTGTPEKYTTDPYREPIE